MIRIGILIVGIMAVSTARASCWMQAGDRYGIDPTLLKAIAWKESRGWTGARGPRLKDGNQAIGLMQINTVHMPTLTAAGIRRTDLLDACTSQMVGAWVLAGCIARFGQTWKAVGCYNTGPASTNVAAQTSYVRDVQRYYAAYKHDELREPKQ